jgi:hypothetical protein
LLQSKIFIFGYFHEKFEVISLRPEHRFHFYIATLTVAIMFMILQYLLPLLPISGQAAEVARPIVSILITFSIYGTLVKLGSTLARSIGFVKRHLLGAYYLNGTWVGQLQNKDGSNVLTVEFFEQTLATLKIRGFALDSAGRVQSEWLSTAESINAQDGVLTYTYTCDQNHKKSSFQGIAVFMFERLSEVDAPTGLVGYSADLIDGYRSVNRERKVDDKLLLVEQVWNNFGKSM